MVFKSRKVHEISVKYIGGYGVRYNLTCFGGCPGNGFPHFLKFNHYISIKTFKILLKCENGGTLISFHIFKNIYSNVLAPRILVKIDHPANAKFICKTAIICTPEYILYLHFYSSAIR